jgi:hypothetical protein
MYKGSCLCGAIEYEVTGPLGPIIYCHCSRCRKVNGTAFATNTPIATKDFHITKGQDALRSYSTPEGVHRVFCSLCGSPIISKRDVMPDVVRLRIGTLDTPFEARPTAHIFAASKAEWFDIHDDLPQFAERP